MPEWLSYEWFLPSQFQRFTWEYPYLLLGALLLPLLFLLRWLFNKSSKQKLALNLPTQAARYTEWQAVRYLIPIFLTIAYTLFWVAAARPQRVLESEEEVTVGVNIVLALDISESMLNQDVEPSRLEASKEVAELFVKGRKSDKIGLVVFAGEAYSLCPLTTDHDLLLEFLKETKPSMISTTGTAIGNALAMAVNRLKDMSGDSKVVVLISDGDNTAGDIDPATAAELAVTFGIRVYTIAIGKKDIELNTESLRKVAERGDGNLFVAEDTDSLNRIFNEISNLETVRFNNRVLKEVRDYYQVYLIWALLFLLITFLLKVSFIGNVLED